MIEWTRRQLILTAEQLTGKVNNLAKDNREYDMGKQRMVGGGTMRA